MKNYPTVKRCGDCKWSTTKDGRDWELFCMHPLVNVKDYWYLSKNDYYVGSSCTEERKKKHFASCGIKGKLYENK